MRRIRRLAFVLTYLLVLAGWGLFAFDTFGLWQARQVEAQRALAQAAIRPTSTPAPLVPTPTATAVVPTAIPTVVVMPSPTTVPAVKLHPKSGRYLAAWLPTSFDADQARASFEANKDILDEVSPFWYESNTATGELIPEPGARDVGLVQAAHEANVLVIPTIHNVHAPLQTMWLLNTPEMRRVHIAKLLEEVERYNYDGLDIDYESLPPEARPSYSAFMQTLSEELHARGKLLTVAVHAKTTDQGGLGAFQNWDLLGQICDRVRIMTYDYSWRGGGPGPIAPLAWVTSVAEYARAIVPPGKIQLGVPFYAYDWGAGEAEALNRTWLEVQELISTHGPEVDFREKDGTGLVQESRFVYQSGNRQRTVWFADARALQAKFDLVEKADLGGLAIWRLGSEDPSNWAVIRKQIGDNPSVIQQIMNTYLPDH